MINNHIKQLYVDLNSHLVFLYINTTKLNKNMTIYNLNTSALPSLFELLQRGLRVLMGKRKREEDEDETEAGPSRRPRLEEAESSRRAEDSDVDMDQPEQEPSKQGSDSESAAGSEQSMQQQTDPAARP